MFGISCDITGSAGVTGMIIEALTSWNRHIPREEMKVISPGDLVNVLDSIGKTLIKQGWAVKVR